MRMLRPFLESQAADQWAHLADKQASKWKVVVLLWPGIEGSSLRVVSCDWRKDVENKLKIADKFISKFQLRNDEINHLCGKNDQTLHPVTMATSFYPNIPSWLAELYRLVSFCRSFSMLCKKFAIFTRTAKFCWGPTSRQLVSKSWIKWPCTKRLPMSDSIAGCRVSRYWWSMKFWDSGQWLDNFWRFQTNVACFVVTQLKSTTLWAWPCTRWPCDQYFTSKQLQQFYLINEPRWLMGSLKPFNRYILDEYCSSRRNAIVKLFIDALTKGGPNGNPRPIELNSHDPIRYMGDMLAWIHQATASEHEFLRSLFRKFKDNNGKHHQFWRQNNLWLIG